MSFKVIDAGLGRTGAASLIFTLGQFGLGPCYHMGEVLTKAQVFEQQI